MIFSSGLFILAREAYNVVVFPQPVGPVTRMMPLGRRMSSFILSSIPFEKPSRSRSIMMVDLSRTLMTTLSPKMVGRQETRRSISLPPMVSFILPSWGSLLSAILRSAMILSREIIAAWRCFGGGAISYNTPSTRYLTFKVSSKGSIWMSDARSFMACMRIRLTSFMMGASEAILLRSAISSSGISSLTSVTPPLMDSIIFSTVSSPTP